MTVANVSANKISTIPRQCHPAAITQMVMDGLHCPLGDVTWNERSQRPCLLVLFIVHFTNIVVALSISCLYILHRLHSVRRTYI